MIQSARAGSLLLAAVILFYPIAGFCSGLSLIQKITAEEVSETILPEGVVVRVDGSNPGDVRIGDGETVGGIRIGDGIGWPEGTPLTQDLNLNGHSINLGSGYTLNMLGGWGAISGPLSAQVDDGKLRISSYGSVLIEAVSEVCSANLAISYDGTYINLLSQIGETKPTIEYTTNLLELSWSAAPVAAIITNETSYVFQISPTNFGTYAYFRAVIPSGSASYVNIKGTLKENGKSVATDEELAGGLATKAPTGAVYRVVLNGVTNNPEAGTIDLGSVFNSAIRESKISCFSDAPQWIYLNSVSYTFPPTDGSQFNLAAPYFNAVGDYGLLRVASGSTNCIFSLKFGNDSIVTNAIRLSIRERWLNSFGQPTGSDSIGRLNQNITYSSNIVTISFPLTNSGTNRLGQLLVDTFAPTNGASFVTNGVWITDVLFQ